jgi:hypothetical protein
MARKHLSTKQVKAKKVTASRMKARAQAAGVPAFSGSKISLRVFFGIEKGKIRKRAFFFALFGLLTFVYAILCMTPLIAFNEGLGAFLFSANAAFGVNYYMNERSRSYSDPVGDYGTFGLPDCRTRPIPSRMPPLPGMNNGV